MIDYSEIVRALRDEQSGTRSTCTGCGKGTYQHTSQDAYRCERCESDVPLAIGIDAATLRYALRTYTEYGAIFHGGIGGIFDLGDDVGGPVAAVKITESSRQAKLKPADYDDHPDLVQVLRELNFVVALHHGHEEGA